jgi:hypothetical protein
MFCGPTRTRMLIESSNNTRVSWFGANRCICMQVLGEGYYIGTTENPIGVFAIIHNLLGIVK